MKIELTGIIENVGGVEALKKGFRQVVVLEQPERRDEYERVSSFAQFFIIGIYSNKQTDSRFLSREHLKKTKKASLYIKGERWIYNGKFQYAVKLNLQEWLS